MSEIGGVTLLSMRVAVRRFGLAVYSGHLWKRNANFLSSLHAELSHSISSS